MKQTFDIIGRVTVDADAGTFSLDGTLAAPPAPPVIVVPPVSAGDAFDLTDAMVTRDSPDVRNWPIGATLTSLGLSLTDTATIDFTKRNGPSAWPFVAGPEAKKIFDDDGNLVRYEGGEIQYTLWVGCFIGGRWWIAGSILCISRAPDDNYVPTGPTLAPGQLPNNWYYFAGNPLAGYQPQHGEPVAWFLTSGAQRRNNIAAIQERTQVVVVAFTPGVYAF